MLNKSKRGYFLSIVNAYQDRLSWIHGDALNRVMGYLYVADLCQGQRIEGQEVAGRGTNEDVAIVVGSVGEARDLTARFECLDYRMLLFSAIK